MNYKIELANINNIDSILELYYERIKWFKDNNIKQWNGYLKIYPKKEFINIIKNKKYYIIKHDDEIVGGFELSTNSKYWNDNITPAYYIYKVVTKVGFKNIGKIIFDKCKEIAIKDGKKYLRLDCLKDNLKLNKIYEKHGFILRSTGVERDYKYALRECALNEL